MASKIRLKTVRKQPQPGLDRSKRFLLYVMTVRDSVTGSKTGAEQPRSVNLHALLHLSFQTGKGGRGMCVCVFVCVCVCVCVSTSCALPMHCCTVP